MIARPSQNIDTCASCHKDIGNRFRKSLHYTTAGLRNGIHKRFSPAQAGQFDAKVFEQSCRSCHASCGDCHVKTPVVSGVNQGLFANHRFRKKNEGKTCAACHGGRIYAEFTGIGSGVRDIHFEKGMNCLSCHNTGELHGDGSAAAGKNSVPGKPSCTGCHKISASSPGSSVHKQHADKTSCQACHVASEYNQCSSCHIGKGASMSQAFLLGRDPRNRDRLVTLRMTPVSRDTFAAQGISMDNYDLVANFWTAPVHNIRKKTARTRTCGPCHTENKEGFISEKTFPKGGSKQNSILLYDDKAFKKYKKQ
ncbi:MAG: hypothetical protein CSYNP_04138 [Syntrophus sp. SKADARSKE-3]|nr:hypothetical protein [Syntrophus sp. SKADARSKE-3]